MNRRFLEIDLLRGLAIFSIILIHTSYYFLSDKLALFLWNINQYSVPVFLFCSGFIFFNRYQSIDGFSFFEYVYKRFCRLLIPYYIFLVFFIPLVAVIQPGKVTFTYIWQSIVLIGGVDINWLVLLFLCLSLLMPFILYLWQKQRILFYLFTFISLLTSFLFIFWHFPFSYKWIMWLTWSAILVFSLFFVKNSLKKWFYPVSLITSSAIFLILYSLENSLHHSLSFYDNKYPANFYYLSYGIAAITLLFYLAKYNFFKTPANKLLNFLSIYSYQIFFIHYFLLTFFVNLLPRFNFNWLTFFLTVFISSLLLQKLLIVTRPLSFLENLCKKNQHIEKND